MMSMSKLLYLCLLLGVFTICHGSESHDIASTFIEDIMQTWKLHSPTIVANDLPGICMKHQWLLCLSNDQDELELANHLAFVHHQGKQDGIIFIGRQGTESLLTHLTLNTSSIFTSNYPVFMPTSYKSSIKLRLDSNILF